MGVAPGVVLGGGAALYLSSNFFSSVARAICDSPRLLLRFIIFLRDVDRASISVLFLTLAVSSRILSSGRALGGEHVVKFVKPFAAGERDPDIGGEGVEDCRRVGQEGAGAIGLVRGELLLQLCVSCVPTARENGQLV